MQCVLPLIVKCRRFWYAYQHEGEIALKAPVTTLPWPKASPRANEADAMLGADQLMDYLEKFARRVINN